MHNVPNKVRSIAIDDPVSVVCQSVCHVAALCKND